MKGRVKALRGYRTRRRAGELARLHRQFIVGPGHMGGEMHRPCNRIGTSGVDGSAIKGKYNRWDEHVETWRGCTNGRQHPPDLNRGRSHEEGLRWERGRGEGRGRKQRNVPLGTWNAPPGPILNLVPDTETSTLPLWTKKQRCIALAFFSCLYPPGGISTTPAPKKGTVTIFPKRNSAPATSLKGTEAGQYATSARRVWLVSYEH